LFEGAAVGLACVVVVDVIVLVIFAVVVGAYDQCTVRRVAFEIVGIIVDEIVCGLITVVGVAREC